MSERRKLTVTATYSTDADVNRASDALQSTIRKMGADASFDGDSAGALVVTVDFGDTPADRVHEAYWTLRNVARDIDGRTELLPVLVDTDNEVGDALWTWVLSVLSLHDREINAEMLAWILGLRTPGFASVSGQ